MTVFYVLGTVQRTLITLFCSMESGLHKMHSFNPVKVIVMQHLLSLSWQSCTSHQKGNRRLQRVPIQIGSKADDPFWLYPFLALVLMPYSSITFQQSLFSIHSMDDIKMDLCHPSVHAADILCSLLSIQIPFSLQYVDSGNLWSVFKLFISSISLSFTDNLLCAEIQSCHLPGMQILVEWRSSF